VALVGYTNAGKSTLLKTLSNADVFIEDRLFATLDTTVRKVAISAGREVLLSDTVGFIRKLPSQLVASFKSTLTEVVESDLLLHVVDVSHPQFREQIAVVASTLEELGAADKPVLYVFNKIDAVKDRDELTAVGSEFTPSVFIAAARNINTAGLIGALEEMLQDDTVVIELNIPQSEYGSIAQIHELGEVLEKSYEGNMINIRYRISTKQQDRLKKALSRYQAKPDKSQKIRRTRRK